VLTPQEVKEFFQILRRMRDQGKTVIIITHKLEEVLAISDEVTVMRDGRVAGRRQTRQTNTAELARMMVGRDVLLRVEKKPAEPGAALLRVRNFGIRGHVSAVSFDVRAGEILGIAGVEGNGQTELIEGLAGLVDTEHMTGAVEFEGENITAVDSRIRKERGIAHVPEDRHRRGLLLDSSLAENSILGIHYRKPAVTHDRGVMLAEHAIQARARHIIEHLDVRPPNAGLPASALSGGNQQKLIIGREFELPPKLLLVSQPTRGVDIGAIEFIHRKLVDLRDSGCAVLLVSAELEEVTALADRLLVIYEGRIVGELNPQEATREEIGLMMTGGAASA
jgi:simple sugar transport system ATP-binding protein